MTLAAFLAITIDSAMEGALLLVLFELSHGMEDLVTSKAKGALHQLNQIAPKFASVLDDSHHTYEKSVREIVVGEKILVQNGEVIPLDGKVVEGSSSLDLVHLTGESLPQEKTIGDKVPAGAKVLEAALVIEVERTSRDSTLTRMIQLITEASEAKPKLQRWLDSFSQRYAVSIIALTFLFALFLPLFFSMGFLGPEGSIYRSLAFLIAASPCALIIATPTAYLSAISASAKTGILLKGGVTLDALANCRRIAFDKTGTLTTGSLRCVQEDLPDEAIQVAYSLERSATHPIAKAISALASKKNLPPLQVAEFRVIPGSGLEGIIEGEKAIIASPKYLKIETQKKNVLAALSYKGHSYLFEFEDQIRENLKKPIESLPLETVILSGDHEESVRRVASVLGIEKVHANLLPEDKMKKVAELSEEGLAMVGDGINDAPALARASVGISMGKIGSASAIDASDVVLLNDDLKVLPWLFEKAKSTQKIVRQNITLALIVICFATTPALLGLVPLWLAVILHEGGTVLVGLNSLRLLKTLAN